MLLKSCLLRKQQIICMEICCTRNLLHEEFLIDCLFLSGLDGLPGVQGAQGVQGETGSPGHKGLPGYSGTPGFPGKEQVKRKKVKI